MNVGVCTWSSNGRGSLPTEEVLKMEERTFFDDHGGAVR